MNRDQYSKKLQAHTPFKEIPAPIIARPDAKGAAVDNKRQEGNPLAS